MSFKSFTSDLKLRHLFVTIFISQRNRRLVPWQVFFEKPRVKGGGLQVHFAIDLLTNRLYNPCWNFFPVIDYRCQNVFLILISTQMGFFFDFVFDGALIVEFWDIHFLSQAKRILICCIWVNRKISSKSYNLRPHKFGTSMFRNFFSSNQHPYQVKPPIFLLTWALHAWKTFPGSLSFVFFCMSLCVFVWRGNWENRAFPPSFHFVPLTEPEKDWRGTTQINTN